VSASAPPDRSPLVGYGALVLASLAIAWRATPEGGLGPFAPALLFVAFAALASALLGGLIVGACESPSATSLRVRVVLPSTSDLALATPSLVVTWLVAVAPGPFGCAGIAAVALYLFVSRARRDVMRPSIDTHGRGAIDLWAASLFVLAGAFLVVYLGVALDMVGGRENDASYYFGVARWMAAHGTLEEPIVWHFLAPPRAIVHPAFDYWQGLTSVLLAIPMAIFGRTHLVASVTMAVLSALSVLLFTYLVVVARPLASRATQLAAVLAFALSPAMQAFRFDTETLVVFHLGLLASLVAIAHGRTALAAALAFLVFLTRADGLVTCGLVWVFLIVRALPGLRTKEGRVGLARIALAIAAVLGLYVWSNLARFGHTTPPGARQAPFLTEYLQLYVYDPRRHPGSIVELLTARATLANLENAVDDVRHAFENIDYVLEEDALLAMLPLGLVVFFRARTDASGLHRLSLALALFGALAIAWIGPVVFSEGRTLHGLVPAMTLAVMMGAELPARALAHALAKRRPELSRTVFALATAAILVPTLMWLRPYRPLAILRTDFEAELASLDPLLEGANVATTTPWWVIANTESPAVLLPAQSEDSMARVLHRYDVQYVLFTRDDVEGWGPASWAVWGPYRDGRDSTIGPFRLELVTERTHVKLYRLVWPEPRVRSTRSRPD